MKPEPTFDVLVILSEVQRAYPDLHTSELHSLLYLAQLLSVYDRHPSEQWQYSFVHHRLGGPFSPQVADAITAHLRTGNLISLPTASDRVRLVEKGVYELSFLSTLKVLEWRLPYLRAAAEAAVCRPLPAVVKSVHLEPSLGSASRTEVRKVLAESLADLDELYDHFGALKQVLGSRLSDVWLAALVWLDYLHTTQMERPEEQDG